MVQYVLKKAEEEGFPQDNIPFVDLWVLYDCLVNHMTSHKPLSHELSSKYEATKPNQI